MSKNVTKLLISTIVMLIAIITAVNVVEAKHLDFGTQTVTAAGYRGTPYPNDQFCVDGQPGNETFCIANHRALSTETYNVTNYIHIDGQKSTVYTGNTNAESAIRGGTTSPVNAALAWILAQPDEGSLPYSSIYSNKQRAIYAYFTTWKNTNGLSDVYTYGDPANQNWEWVRRAEQYAQTVPADAESGQKAAIEDHTGKVDNRNPIDIDGKEMVRLGVFNMDFIGKIDYLKVIGKDGNEISALFAKYEGEDIKTSSDPNEIIKSGEDFYIIVPGDGSVLSIKSIDVQVSLDVDIYQADIWILQRLHALKQNLITVDTKSEPQHSTADIQLPTPEPPPSETPTPETPTPETPTPETPTPETPTSETPPSEPPPPDIPVPTKLQVVKVNKDAPEIRLGGVGFIFQKKDLGKFIKQRENPPSDLETLEWTDNREDATVFTTDENGELVIDNVIPGTYIAYEVANTHYGYEVVEEGIEIVVEETEGVIRKNTIENKQVLIKLSGYVWEDMPFDRKDGEDFDMEGTKDGIHNNLYKDNSLDDRDVLKEGIPVRLKSVSTGETIQETVTDQDGAYLFEDVEIVKLEDYYIEFEYDGLVYTNVIPYIEPDNGSKAAENAQGRAEFNESFANIQGKDAEANTGVSTNSKGEETHQLKYIRGEGEDLYSSHLDESLYFPITANTNEAGYYINNHFSWGTEEIKYINLGIYKREQPDLMILKDVQNSIVSINGYNHTYNYANRFKNQDEYKAGFNVGVKFGGAIRADKYTRAIYKSDATFVDTVNENKSNELKVAITYRISFVNESTNLGARVNSIVDYYDKNYTIKAVGTGINEKGLVTGELKYEEGGDYNNDYKIVRIQTDGKMLDPGKQISTEDGSEEAEYNSGDVYVQFEMNRETTLRILKLNENDEDPKGPLVNRVEIASYSTFDSDGNIYAGIDKDSAPENSILDKEETLEDDIDLAPSMILQFAGDNRVVTGNAFEDVPELKKDFEGGSKTLSGKERLGNGKYEPEDPEYPEKGIEGIEARLINLDLKDNEIQYDENGMPKLKYDSSGEPEIAVDYSATADTEGESQENIEGGTEAQIRKITATTGADGKYELKGFVPNKYVIQFVWGGKTYIYYAEGSEEPQTKENKYNAIDYKSTTMPEDEYNRKYNDSPNFDWYKEYKEDLTKDPRYNDAIDDQNIRTIFDNVVRDQVYGNSKQNLDIEGLNMHSYSAPLNITLEFTDINVTETEIDENGTKDVFLAYTVPNIDFGIIERPRQNIELDKRVSSIRFTLSNGEIISEVDINEDGTHKGNDAGFIYLSPSPESVNGMVKLEIDQELLEGSSLMVEYEFKAKNISEIDYEDWNYYVYGKPSEGAQLRTLSASEIIDYLDGDWGYDKENEINTANKWQQVDRAFMETYTKTFNINGEDKKYDMFAPEVKANDNLNNRKILITDVLVKDLLPTGTEEETTAKANLEVSKVLANADDISLDNEAEITHVHKEHGGREIESIPGNYVAEMGLEILNRSSEPSTVPSTDPSTATSIDPSANPSEVPATPESTTDVTIIPPKEADTALAETVVVTPPTGADAITYVIYTATAIVGLAIIAGGIVIIKKKVLGI